MRRNHHDADMASADLHDRLEPCLHPERGDVDDEEPA